MTDGLLRWAGNAVKQMRFAYDRETVRRELLDHMEDRRSAYIGQGLSDQEAEARTLTAMGDPVETGKLLNRVHSPWLGWLWLLSRMISVGLAVCLVLWLILNGYQQTLLRMWSALTMDDPCMMTQWYEEQEVPYTLLEDTVSLEVGDYSMRLDHGFYSMDADSYDVYLGWQVWTWKPWLDFPAGLTNMVVEDSDGNRYTDISRQQPGAPHAEFYFNTTGALLPVWQFHVELLYLPVGGETAFPEWLRFSIPGTDTEFTLYLDGEVRT